MKAGLFPNTVKSNCSRSYPVNTSMEFPWAYQKIEPTTWAYVSSLLMLALFFKFSRVWSVRNLDLVLIILLAPGLLLYDHGTSMEYRAVVQLADLGEPVPLSLTSGGLLEAGTELPAAESSEPEEVTPESSENGEAESPSGGPAADASTGSATPDAEPDTRESGAAGTQETQADGASDPEDTELNEGMESPVTDGQVNETTEESGTEVVERTGRVLPTDLDASIEALSGIEVAKLTPEQRAELVQYWLGRRALSHILLHTSFLFLLSVAGIFVLRLLLDQLLVRRPMLENNLSVGGLTFLVCSFLTFQFANILISSATQSDLYGAQAAAGMLGDGQADVGEAHQEMGPAYPLIHLLPVIPTVIRDIDLPPSINESRKSELRSESLVWVAKLVAILSQLSIVAGLICLGRYQFNSMQTGVGMATLYLMLPYTAQMAGRVDHVLPGALLIWAVVLYRRPFWAGILFGMTMGLVYYPIFLLALWFSFYWEKGAARFAYGVLTIIGILVLSLLFFSTEDRGFLANLQGMFGVWLPRVSGLKGIWEFGWDPWFRLPVLVAYVSLCVSFVAWPIRKTYGTLLAYSAAVMVAVQFWHGYGGGLFMAWFLPLTIATFFRPNVQDRIAKFDVY